MRRIILASLIFSIQCLWSLPLLTNSSVGRYEHTATLLTDGRVLVAGGFDGSSALSSCEIYDPLSNSWSSAAPLSNARRHHTATVLPNGNVLVAGGSSGGSSLTSLEVYEPSTNTWSNLANFEFARALHTATLLDTSDGPAVVFVGGQNAGTALSTCEIYVFDAQKLTTTGSLNEGRFAHSASRTTSGLYVAGGEDGSSTLASAELFDPTTGIWSSKTDLSTPRSFHTAAQLTPLVMVLVGGEDNGTPLASTEIAILPSFATAPNSAMATARTRHRSTLLPNQKLFITGGLDSAGNSLSSTEFLTAGVFSAGPTLSAARHSHAACLLPSSNLILFGGSNPVALNSTEIYSYCDPSRTNTPLAPHTVAGSTLTQLPNGSILATNLGEQLAIYDPVLDSWSTPTPPAGTDSTIISEDLLLPDGTVAFRRINAQNLSIFDPSDNSLSSRGADLLPNKPLFPIPSTGQLVALQLSSTEAIRFDPASMGVAPLPFINPVPILGSGFTVSLLPNDNLLFSRGTVIVSPAIELNPLTGEVTQRGSSIYRQQPTSNLLLDGRIFFAGGANGSSVLNSTEIYDSSGGSFSPASNLIESRFAHAATTLPNGKILISGGRNSTSQFSESLETELYDPYSNSTTVGPFMSTERAYHDSILLLDGRVLIFGGSPSRLPNIVDPGIIGITATRPTITNPPSSAAIGSVLSLTGSNFSPISSAASGNSGSSDVNFPVVQLRHLASGRYTYLPLTAWSGSTLATSPLAANIPLGYHAVAVVSNGIPSVGTLINVIGEPMPTVANSDNEFGADANFVHVIGAASPAPFDFTLGSSSGPIENLSVSFSGPDATAFAVAQPLPSSVPIGDPTPLQIAFTPSSGGTSIRNANLVLTFDSPNSPISIPVAGQALIDGDTDNDGLDDDDEFLTFNTDPLKADTDNDGALDGAEVNLASLGFDPNVDSAAMLALLTANSEGLGLYEPSAFQTLAMSRPLISKNPDDTFTVSVELQQSDDLSTGSFATLTTVTPVSGPSGKVLLTFPAPNPDVSFFQLFIDEPNP